MPLPHCIPAENTYLVRCPCTSFVIVWCCNIWNGSLQCTCWQYAYDLLSLLLSADLGTGRYSSGSLPWFMSIFGAKGIEFDEIFGA